MASQISVKLLGVCAHSALDGARGVAGTSSEERVTGLVGDALLAVVVREERLVGDGFGGGVLDSKSPSGWFLVATIVSCCCVWQTDGLQWCRRADAKKSACGSEDHQYSIPR